MFGWDWREVILLYWLENIIIGLIALVRMIRTTNTFVVPGSTSTLTPGQVNVRIPPLVIKLFSCVFFILHYGIFTSVHGMFVFILINQGFGEAQSFPPLNYTPIIILWLVMLIVQVGRELMQPSSGANMRDIISAPYKRILPLHFAIIIGGFVMASLDLPAAAAILLIVLHAVFDIFGGLSRRFESPATILK